MGVISGIEYFISTVTNEGFVPVSSNCHHHFCCVPSTVQADLCHWQVSAVHSSDEETEAQGAIGLPMVTQC